MPAAPPNPLTRAIARKTRRIIDALLQRQEDNQRAKVIARALSTMTKKPGR